MKNLFILPILVLLLIGCNKNTFDINSPNVEQFVQQIKNGTYAQYENNDEGENLWLLMPKFTGEHIGALIAFAKDTTHIKYYPFNPISSRTPFPQGKDYCLLGECLLWTVEGIRNKSGYGSLDPILINTTLDESAQYNGLSGKEIQSVSDIYKNWWRTYKNKDWENQDPLANTSYHWY
ncbi:MAG: DUF4943 family protein [Niabella sp.]